MWMAIASVAAGTETDAVVSAGNTGALMAMSKLQLRPMTGVTRPAIAAFFPTVGELVCMLDLGANIECDAENLVQFAILGQAFHRSLTGKESPRLGLLNVGEEEQKGHDYLRVASRRLSDPELGMNYQGFVEGSRSHKWQLDVVVTDGFSGNIALKMAEGISSMFTALLRRSFEQIFRCRAAWLSVWRAVRCPRCAAISIRASYNGRCVPGSQRHCREIAWRHRPDRLCQRHQCGFRARRSRVPSGCQRMPLPVPNTILENGKKDDG